MSDIAIRAQNIGKQYRFGGKPAGYRTFREAVLDSFAAPFRWMRGERKEVNTFWALDDVSFEIKHGEAVGIIGRNGAGKSTLLKILSRITKPTKGRVDLYGRVASLLEVGTGFHSELSGRDNVYLNGAILGMSRKEINRKFDEIVYFSGVEKFLDMPVKHYSSGMYVRLAFAVAAHLEPEILIVDEVLAVGDAEFQKKCLGKMEDVAKQGRTVLFVSHNLGAVANLCTTAFLLQSGSVVLAGKTSDVVNRYQSLASSDNGFLTFEHIESDAFFTKISVCDKVGNATTDISVVDNFILRFEYVVNKKMKNLDVAFMLFDRNGSKVFTCSLSRAEGEYFTEHKPGKFIAEIPIPAKFLAPGMYFISPVIHQPNIKIYDLKNQALQFKIAETGSMNYRYAGTDVGSVLVSFDWKIQELINIDIDNKLVVSNE